MNGLSETLATFATTEMSEYVVLLVETTLAPGSVIPLVWSASFIVRIDGPVANEDNLVTSIGEMQCFQFGMVPQLCTLRSFMLVRITAVRSDMSIWFFSTRRICNNYKVIFDLDGTNILFRLSHQTATSRRVRAELVVIDFRYQPLQDGQGRLAASREYVRGTLLPSVW